MIPAYDALRYQRALERWRTLAEKRLAHMTVLYETGRWRRYFTEERFLNIIRETKASVEIWQRLASERGTSDTVEVAAGPAFTRTPPSPFAIASQRSVA